MKRDLGTAVALPPLRRHWARTVALCIVTLVIASWSTPAAFATGDVPTVTINQAASQPDPDSETPIKFDVKFSEPVEAFVPSGISFAGSTAGGVLTPVITGSGADYTVTVTGMSTGGTVVASVKPGAANDIDSDGNVNLPSTSTDNTVTWVPGPAPTVTINQAASQPDPDSETPISTSTDNTVTWSDRPTSLPAPETPIVFDVKFSEPVQGFAWDRISFAGSTTDGVLFPTITGSGADYTVSVTGMRSSGTVVASVKPGAAFDADGFSNTASTSSDNTVTWVPGPAPTVTINQAPSQPDPASGSEVVFDVVFSEPVQGLDDFSTDLTGSTAGPVLFTQVIGTGAVYQVKVFGMTTDAGVIVASIPAGAVVDADGFKNAASTSLDNTVTWDPSPPYDFTGFFQPVDMDKLNTAKAGSAIPIKFSLDGDPGLGILRDGYPKVTRIGCTTSTATDEIESTLTAGSSGLTYDAATDNYTYAWKTSKSWAGGCYRFELGLDDGSSHTFNVAFPR